MDLSKIPNRLRGEPYFCLMKLEQKPGKVKKDKVPYRTNGARADPTNPDHFTSIEKVMKVFDKGGYDGIGIGLFDDIIAIDIDDCVENGKLSAMAAEIVDSLGSYAELSISGTGVHIWAREPGLIYDKERYCFNNRTYGLEIYPAGVTTKFIVTTGNAINDCDINECTEAFIGIAEKYIQEGNESHLAKYREKKPLWSNVAVGRILSNEQYTGTMVYNRFKSEDVGDKHAKALTEEEWKRVENCHVVIISREDFEKVSAMRKSNTCAGAKRKHETHCLTGKMICGNCGHRLSHSYSGRPKYYCAKHYLDKADGKCNISVLDATMEEVVMKSLQLFIDMWVDSRKIVDVQRKKQAQRMAVAEKHLVDMENSNERLNKDLRDAYESYKLGMTDKETYLEQKKTYEQLLVQMKENIEKQKVAVSKMAQVDLPEVAGFEMLEGQMKMQKLNKKMVDAFVEEIVVYAKDMVEIKWKFRDEFKETKMIENDRDISGE